MYHVLVIDCIELEQCIVVASSDILFRLTLILVPLMYLFLLSREVCGLVSVLMTDACLIFCTHL